MRPCMGVTREFFDWSRPLAPQAAEWLLAQAAGTPADLSGWLVLVPGGRLRRSLLDHLMRRTGGRFLPPEIVTPSEFPERLYPVDRPLASRWVQQLAWRKAALSLEPDQLRAVLRQPPDEDAFREWMALGQLFAEQHEELAADTLEFSHVPKRGGAVEGFAEADRWESLAAIEDAYLATLDGFEVWDKQSARLFPLTQSDRDDEAIRRRRLEVRDAVGSAKRIALIGATDLSRSVRELLGLASEKGPVTALVHASGEAEEGFDGFGLLNVPYWLDRRVPVEDEHLMLAGRPEEQAEAVGHAIAGFGGRSTADVIVGCPDAALARLVERRLKEAGVEAVRSVGRPLDRTAAGSLLRAVAEHLERDDSATLGRLLRHPDFEAYLNRAGVGGALREYDDLLGERLLRRVDAEAAMAHPLEDRRKPALAAACGAAETLLSGLRGDDRDAKAWTGPLLDALSKVYEGVDAGDELRSALECIQDVAGELAATPDGLCPDLSAAETARVILGRMASGTRPTPDASAAVEVTGWLELPQDDRPAAVLTGLNEGLIPTSRNEDAFLPNRVRTALGVTDNDRRYARDAYALSVVLHSRPDVRLVVGRTDGEGKPLQPSRLLFTGERDEVVRRVRMLTEDVPRRPPLASDWSAGAESWAVPIPKPRQPDRPLKRVSVTALRLMIASPVRFWLRHVERLRDVDAETDELAPRQFGDLVHDVLARFSNGPHKDAATADAIAAAVLGDLDAIAGGRFGRRPPAAVAVQVEQARHRLRTFAEHQAKLRAEGWSIHRSEEESDAKQGGRLEVPFDLPDGRTIELVGYIDRLDRHADGTYRVVDYKTADTGVEPAKKHLNREGVWTDLQLPLYRTLATAWGVGRDEPLEVGYFNLPKSEEKAGVHVFKGCDFADAEAVASELFMRILDGDYFEQTPAEVDYDDFAAILQTDVFGGGPSRNPEPDV